MNIQFLLPIICLLACFLCLYFEANNLTALGFKAKILASLSFVGFAWDLGAMESQYGKLLLLGLMLSLIGDVLLGKKNFKPGLLLGIAAFLMVHVLYALAFLSLGFDTSKLPLLLTLIILLMIITGWWLNDHLKGVFKYTVPLYLLAIGSMLLFAWGNQAVSSWALIACGASLFAVSDLFVAKNRFIKSNTSDRLIGLPIYYLAQLMLAFSINNAPII